MRCAAMSWRAELRVVVRWESTVNSACRSNDCRESTECNRIIRPTNDIHPPRQTQTHWVASSEIIQIKTVAQYQQYTITILFSIFYFSTRIIIIKITKYIFKRLYLLIFNFAK